ncbi:MAG: hypothetical protein QNJ14_04805 [Woeseiaceae bacterium]|nr:hypothetical protein [Woeseiaceae bacterium]
MVIRFLPILTGLAPLIGVNLAYWIGVQHENLPSCIPYVDGCTSISATGRYPPGDRLFRAVMLPQSAWLILTWHFSAAWLRTMRRSRMAAITTETSGLVGAAALIVYVSYLASNDPFYEVMRRYGIYLYFVGTVVAQIAVTLALRPSRLRKVMLWIIAMPFVLGIYNFVQKAYISDLNSIENRIEWIVSVLMQLWFLALYLAWRKSNFKVVPRTSQTIY